MSRSLIYLLALVGLLGIATIDAGVAVGNKNATGVIPVRTNNLVNMLAQKEGGGAQIEKKGEVSSPSAPSLRPPHPPSKPIKKFTGKPIKKHMEIGEPGHCPYGHKGNGCWVCTIAKDGVSCIDDNGKQVCSMSPGCAGKGADRCCG